MNQQNDHPNNYFLLYIFNMRNEKLNRNFRFLYLIGEREKKEARNPLL